MRLRRVVGDLEVFGGARPRTYTGKHVTSHCQATLPCSNARRVRPMICSRSIMPEYAGLRPPRTARAAAQPTYIRSQKSPRMYQVRCRTRCGVCFTNSRARLESSRDQRVNDVFREAECSLLFYFIGEGDGFRFFVINEGFLLG